ncbi:MAG TPA: tripartite tricarboxylate transporter substrate binding protein [Casimicrobiaceae bacterium]|nr:tripartite tricarboxylate transporter substrate binding protein [Casimicrobiaceae bacterium]
MIQAMLSERTAVPTGIRRRAFALLCLALALGATSAFAAYPDRPIRIIVPYTPGTGIDILARVLGDKLAQKFGVGVVVDNRPGASGNIGTEAVSKAAPDGYTLLMQASTHVTNPALQASVPYDPIRGFTPIGPAAIGSLALVVNPSLPVKSVPELVALAKAQPGKLNYASPGSGTPHHLAMELFKQHFGVDIVHVPYKGTAGAVTDLLSGQVQMMFLPVHVALPQVQSGKLRMLAAGGAHRSPVTPDVPSLADEGLTDIDVDIWYALLGPPGMAPEQVALLNREVNALLANPEVRETLVKQGLNPTPGTPEELARTIETDLDRWTRLIRAAKIKAD